MHELIERLFRKSERQCHKEAEIIYQVREFDGTLWLTYQGALVCPADMFTPPPIEALEVIRSLYVKRNTTGHDQRGNQESV